ncbi:MAG: DUF998 domain-containing protein [Acidobacteriota bacterium]|nr:DUF998 domain-containing protein [Acidobacteriota bacterium]
MQDNVSSASAGTPLTRNLLRCGIAAGPLYVIVGLAQVATREGFDVRRHALSLLSNGDLGWIQILNFVASGFLVIAGAIGLRKVLRGSRGGTWAPLLLVGYGVGLIGAGVFVADPGLGFPPGASPESTDMSRSGLLHFVFGGFGFYALIGASFVFSRRFKSLKETPWSVYSLITGLGFLVSFAAIASGSKSPAVILAFYAAVLWVWAWHSAVCLKVMRDVPGLAPEVQRSRAQAG